MMSIQQALVDGRGQLTGSPSPALDARLLLQHVLQRSHSYLIAHGDNLLTNSQLDSYHSLLKRAAGREPIPYLIGSAPFTGRDFAVSPAVLIPRPETEQLVEIAVAWARDMAAKKGELNVVDVGTGSGCVAITMALQLPNARIEATDISTAALEVAGQNAASHGVTDRVRFHQGSLLEPVSGRIDLIVANLPYITDHEWTTLDDGVKWYEPDIALRGGSDGLDHIRLLLNQAARRLAPGGAIFLEIGWQQGPAVRHLAQSHFPRDQVNILPDLAGIDRIVGIVHMQTKLLDADQPSAIEEAARLLEAGHLIAFPTDTLYGVGAKVEDLAAINRLYETKGRSAEKGIPILLSDIDKLNQVVSDIPTVALSFAKRFWPGPLTLVLPKRSLLPAGLSPDDNIAVRIPNNDVARRFIRAAGGAVATSSANRSGEPPALNAREAMLALSNAVAAVLDGGPVFHGVASTIVDCTVSPPKVLREGPLKAEELFSKMVKEA